MTGIVDSEMNVVVEYSYDAWGKLIDTTGSEADFIGKLNPFLYRGYYYDADTGLYYLGGRYYDPVVGRYLNADFQIGANQDITSYNLFAYCGNNPVNRADPTGQFWKEVGNWFKSTFAMISSWVNSTYNKISTWVESNPVTSIAATAFGAIAQQAADDAISSKVDSIKIKKPLWTKSTDVKARNPYVKRTVTLPDTKPLSAAKKVSKKVGAFAAVTFGADIIHDTQMYSGGNLAKAIGIDTTAFIVSVGIGSLIAASALPVIAVFGLTVVGGVIISAANEQAKDTFLN